MYIQLYPLNKVKVRSLVVWKVKVNIVDLWHFSYLELFWKIVQFGPRRLSWGRMCITIVMNFWKNVKLSWPSQVPRPSCELGNLTRLTPRNYNDLWPMVAFAILVISTFQISPFMTIIATWQLLIEKHWAAFAIIAYLTFSFCSTFWKCKCKFTFPWVSSLIIQPWHRLRCVSH